MTTNHIHSGLQVQEETQAEVHREEGFQGDHLTPSTNQSDCSACDVTAPPHPPTTTYDTHTILSAQLVQLKPILGLVNSPDVFI